MIVSYLQYCLAGPIFIGICSSIVPCYKLEGLLGYNSATVVFS